MHILPFAIGGLLGGSILKKAFGGSKKPTPQPAPLPTPTRDDAAAEADRRLELARRRGGAADVLTGAYGAEATAGAKTTLGS